MVGKGKAYSGIDEFRQKMITLADSYVVNPSSLTKDDTAEKEAATSTKDKTQLESLFSRSSKKGGKDQYQKLTMATNTEADYLKGLSQLLDDHNSQKIYDALATIGILSLPDSKGKTDTENQHFRSCRFGRTLQYVKLVKDRTNNFTKAPTSDGKREILNFIKGDLDANLAGWRS
jgi:hypothetical protein